MANPRNTSISEKLPQSISIAEFSGYLDSKVTQVVEEMISARQAYQAQTQSINVGEY